MVVIDVGYGGKDFGCYGVFVYEKNVCFFMVLLFGVKIKEVYLNIKVVYICDKDVFVEFDDCVKIVNKNNVDLFICIYVNFVLLFVFGMEIYVLGFYWMEVQ